MENICQSGGSKGADILWGQLAKKAGHTVKHFSFVNHAYCGDKEDCVILNDLQLSEGVKLIEKANSYLKRKYPTGSIYVDNLIKRNYWQIKGSSSIYATQELGDDGLVNGGTGFTVTMGILSGIEEIYLYEPVRDSWFKWNGNLDDYRNWDIINSPPKPSGIYTGIGAHDLSMPSYIAIKRLWE